MSRAVAPDGALGCAWVGSTPIVMLEFLDFCGRASVSCLGLTAGTSGVRSADA